MRTVQECQAYVDRVVHSDWWTSRSMIREVEVRDGRGRRSACATTRYGRPVIKLPLWARTPDTILHELAHHLNTVGYDHGKEFKAAFYALAKRFEPALAPRLKEQWKGKSGSKFRGLEPRVIRSPNRETCVGCGRRARRMGWSATDVAARFCTKRCATQWFETRLARR
jgi:hypothetical protein